MPLNRKMILISHKMEKNSQSISFFYSQNTFNPSSSTEYKTRNHDRLGTGNSEAHREAARVDTLSFDVKFVANTNIIFVPFWWYAAFF